MPNYKITLTRTWTETDTLERVIEADSPEQANEKAAAMCTEFDHGCPDDITTSKDGEADDWGVEDVEETDEELSDPRCRTEGCDGDPDDGEGWDGYCGNCADKQDERDGQS